MSPEASDHLPPALRAAFAGWAWHEAWGYLGVTTVWRVTHPDGHSLFVKIGGHDRVPRMTRELARLAWAAAYVSVPRVVGRGAGAGREWFEMEPLAGLDATVHPHRVDPARLVPALARGLRAFHDALPVERCPFDERSEVKLAHVRRRAAAGLIVPARDFHREFAHLSVDEAVQELERRAPGHEDLVVGHRDYCLPNVMLDERGDVTGYLDLGELGVCDRRSDVVVGAWSVTWNLGPDWEELFYDEYGLVPTVDEITFYRLLYDLDS